VVNSQILDEATLVTILTRHFQTATSEALHGAAQDVMLLDLLSRDTDIVWEDEMHTTADSAAVDIVALGRCRES